MMTLKLSKHNDANPPDEHAIAKINALYAVFVLFQRLAFSLLTQSMLYFFNCSINQSIKFYSQFLGTLFPWWEGEQQQGR